MHIFASSEVELIYIPIVLKSPFFLGMSEEKIRIKAERLFFSHRTQFLHVGGLVDGKIC